MSSTLDKAAGKHIWSRNEFGVFIYSGQFRNESMGSGGVTYYWDLLNILIDL